MRQRSRHKLARPCTHCGQTAPANVLMFGVCETCIRGVESLERRANEAFAVAERLMRDAASLRREALRNRVALTRCMSTEDAA